VLAGEGEAAVWLIDRHPSVTFVPTYQSLTGGKQMKLKPLGARALVKMVESEEQTASGIVLPDTAREKPQTAEIVAVGASDEVNVSAGDVVVLAKYSGTEVKIESWWRTSPMRRGTSSS